MRELARQKDQESDRLKESEARREAEIKLQERLNQSLSRDKKDLETRIEELLTRLDNNASKYKE